MPAVASAPTRPPRADKVAVVDEVRQRFAEAEAVLFTEYRGLDVTELADLRGRLIDADCRYKIFKNTLVRRALSAEAPDEVMSLLLGPTALAFCDRDPSQAAKALREFAEEHESLVIKGGILAGTLLNDTQVRELADLPSRNELMAQMLGAFGEPLSSLVSMMNNLIGEMSGLVQALIDRSASGSVDDPPEVPPDQPPDTRSDDPADPADTTDLTDPTDPTNPEKKQ